MMEWRRILLLAGAGLLAGCSQSVELVGFCSLDDPASEWVVANTLERQAEQHCQGPYRITQRRNVKRESGTEYHWSIDCGGPRS